MGIILSRTRTTVSWPFRGLTTDLFQVTSVFRKYNYFAGSSFITLTWPCHCTAFGMTLAITCDVGVLRGTHIGPLMRPIEFCSLGGCKRTLAPCWAKMALVEVDTWVPRGNLLQVPMDTIIGNPCVAHENVSHWPFMGLIGFCYLGLRVEPSWTSVEGKTWAQHSNWLQVPMGPSSDSACVAHESARHWPFMGPMGFCYLENLSKRWQ